MRTFKIGQTVTINSPINFYNGRQGVVREIATFGECAPFVTVLEIGIPTKSGGTIVLSLRLDEAL